MTVLTWQLVGYLLEKQVLQNDRSDTGSPVLNATDCCKYWYIPGGPKKTEQVAYVAPLPRSTSYGNSECWIEHRFFIIITPSSWKTVEELFILWVISYGLSFLGFAISFSSGGSPPKKRNSQFFRTVLWWTVINFTLLDRASVPHDSDTKIIKFGLKTFYFRSNFLSTVIFGICTLICHRASKLWKSGRSRKWQSISNV